MGTGVLCYRIATGVEADSGWLGMKQRILTVFEDTGDFLADFIRVSTALGME